jgi:hypothetical protein
LNQNWNLNPLIGSMQLLLVRKNVAAAYDKNGVIATDIVPPGFTVTGAYYRKLLEEVFAPKGSPKTVRHVRSRCPHFAR